MKGLLRRADAEYTSTNLDSFVSVKTDGEAVEGDEDITF